MRVVVLALLLLVSKSVSVALTVAELMTCPGFEGVTTIVTVALLPTARLPRLQSTGPLPLQLPCVAVAETNTTPAGSVSMILTLVPFAGPLLVATSRYERVAPACPGFGETVLVKARSALNELTTFRFA